MSGTAIGAAWAAFSCGVILLYRLPVLPAWTWLAGAAIVVFLIASRRRARVLAALLAASLAGMAWAAWHAETRLAQRLPPSLEGQPVIVRGYVCDLPTPGRFQSLRFRFCVTEWPGQTQGIHPPDTLRLSWYRGSAETLRRHRLQLDVVLKRPHGALNAAGFRYEDWLFRHGYRATGSVRSAAFDPAVPCHGHCRYALARQALADWVEARFGALDQYPLIASLMIGNRQAMSEEHWALLKATGTVHLVAISGLHLGLVALAVAWLSWRLLLMLPVSWLSERTLRRLVFFLVVAGCLCYALVAGFTVPTRRALVMVTIASWTLLCAREPRPWQSFFTALGLVLMADPFAPLDPGFWLSFAAVAVLLWVLVGRLGPVGWLPGLILTQVAVFAGLWPILASLEQGQPLAGLVANLFAIPWVSVLVMPALALAAVAMALAPGLAEPVVPGLDVLLGGLWQLLAWVASWPWPEPAYAGAGTLGLVAAVLLLALRLPLPGLPVAVLLSLLVWWWSPVPSPASTATESVTVLDVGQGLSVVIQAGGHVLVYDTGPAVDGVFSSVTSTLVPVLRSRGIRRIDHLVLSHADQDHAGDVAGLLARMPVGRIETGEPERIRERLPEAPQPVLPCRRRRETLGGFDLLFWHSRHAQRGNDASCVLIVRHRASGVEWVLPGDLTVTTEQEFLRDDVLQESPTYRIVIAPHHGSKTSSSPAWVTHLAPNLVVYSAGYRHRFGHPHPSVTARYRAVGATALNTACSGSLTFSVAAEELDIVEARSRAPFWISAPGLVRSQCGQP